VAQEQGDGDQPWELAGGHTGDGADESIEFVIDVEFVEEGVDEPTRPLEIVVAVRHFLQNSEAVAFSPVWSLDALRRPGAWLWLRDSSADRAVAHGKTPPAERLALGAKAATLRDGLVARGG
jgi:hypothetical protein